MNVLCITPLTPHAWRLQYQDWRHINQLTCTAVRCTTHALNSSPVLPQHITYFVLCITVLCKNWTKILMLQHVSCICVSEWYMCTEVLRKTGQSSCCSWTHRQSTSAAELLGFMSCRLTWNAGRDFSSAVSKGQQSWWAAIVRQLLHKLFLLCQVKSDLDETWYEWCEGKGPIKLQSRFWIFV